MPWFDATALLVRIPLGLTQDSCPALGAFPSHETRARPGFAHKCGGEGLGPDRYRRGRIQVLDVEGLQEHLLDAMRRSARISAAWLDSRPTPPSARRQRDTKFHGSMSGAHEPTAPRCVGKTGASDGFRHVEN